MNLFLPPTKAAAGANGAAPSGIENVAASGFLALLSAVGSDCRCTSCLHLRTIAASLQTSLQSAAAPAAANPDPAPPAADPVPAGGSGY